jgi:lipopolysaccharide/colanic/teichoic acid biosynthesis glycosyltransferase
MNPAARTFRAPTTYEKLCGRVSLKDLRPSLLIYSGLSLRRHALFYQTVTNLIVAAVGIVIAFLLMALTALAVRFSSAGPVLYQQVRVGMDSQPSRSTNSGRWSSARARYGQTRDDPRVTVVGRIIRKIRFDELRSGSTS